jgi:hypothetical protein
VTTKQKMAQARDLIRARRYDEARTVLESVDHSLAREWLNKLDRTAPADHGPSLPQSYESPVSYEHPSGRAAQKTTSTAPVAGVLLLLVFAVVGGVGAGVLLFFSSTFIYLIFFSPILAAGLAGLIVDQGVRFGKIRDSFTAVLFGLLIGFLLYGTFRYAEYIDFRREVREEILQIQPGADFDWIDSFIDDGLRQDTGYSAFPGYVVMTAREGMSLTLRSRSTRQELDFTIGEGLTVIYWGVEILIMLIVPAGMANRGANQPFCEGENTWLKFKKIGYVPGILAESFIGSLRAGDFYTAGSYIENKGVKVPRLDVEAGRCGDHAPTAQLRVLVNKGNDREAIIVANISATEYNSLIG